MKKAKILAVFGILLAMGITACNNGGESDVQSQETPVTSEQQGGGTSSEHKHKYGDWTQTKAPTCTEKGSKERVCECGEKDVQEIAALGHDFKNGTVTADTSTCTADGKQTIKCARCDATQEVDVKAHHRFGEETAVAAKGDGYVGYKKAECSVDHVLQFKIRALDGTLASGSSIKSGTADGYFKLSSNGHSMSWKFDYQPSSGKTGAIGTVYTLGFMDAWSSNSSKKYGVYSTSSQDTRDAGNFDFTVNGNLVDKKAYMQKTFEELTAGGADSSAVGDNYSPIALIPVGEVVLNSGDNTFVYKRTGSYNFVISDLVFIGSEFSHEHTAATTWSKDENQHWHACTAPGCPVEGGYKMDAANHTFQEVTPEQDTETDAAHKAKAATCSAEGIKVEVCSVCQYRKESVIEKKAHTFPADGGWTVNKAATCDEPGERQHKCTVCEEIVKEVIPALGHDFSGGVAKAYAATADHIAAEAVNCGNCQKSALQWSALDYDVAKSTAASDDGKVPTLKDNDKAIQLDTSTAQGGGENHDQKGCHVIYVVDVPEAVENANLAMLATEAPYRADIFDAMAQENSKGYIQNEAGEWVRPDSRYGIKVDGQEYMVAKNNGAIKGAGTTWYQFPGISLTLTAGVHEFEFFKYGGYDVQNYSFRLIGLSHVAPAHEHTYGAWQSNETNHWKLCTGEGCLDPEGTKYFNAAHNFGDLQVETANTCTTDGAGKYVCQDCGYVKNVVIPAAHTWGDATPVAAGEGTVAYNLFSCSKCDSKKIEVKLDDSMVTGTNKNDPAGFIKLKNKNEYFSFAFDYTSAAFGKIYQRGVMDGWSSNKGKNVFSGGSNGADDFKLTVNGTDVDVSAYKSKKWEDIMVEGENGLSAITDVESGNIQLINGKNTVKYERLASYNMPLTHIVFVFEDSSHEHHAGSAWQSDENQHWHVCDAAGCPTPDAKMDAADHTWGDVVETTAPTCTTAGAGTKECTICHKVVNVTIPALGHNYSAGTAVKNSDNKDVAPIACSKGDSEGYEMALADCSSGADKIESDGKLGKGATLVWKFKLTADGEGHYKTGKIAFIMCAKLNGGKPFGSNDPADNAFADDYSIKVGEKSGTVTCAGKQLGKDFGATADTAVYFEFGTIEFTEADLVDGELVITLTQAANQSYRHKYQDNVRIIYIA